MKVLPHHMPLPPVARTERPAGKTGSFGKDIKAAFEEVNRLQLDAERKTAELAADKKAPLHETMLALEKADISFRLMTRVRNRVLEAYQEVMRMPL